MSVEKTVHVLINIMVPACTSIQCTLRENITTPDGVISERNHINPRNTKMVVLLYLAAIMTFLGERIELDAVSPQSTGVHKLRKTDSVFYGQNKNDK